MHAVKLLHKQLQFACPNIHRKRLATLMCATKTLSEDQRLSITGLGRALKSQTSAKHNIKRIDRLVGNVWLQSERFLIYSAISKWLLGRCAQPIIIVDWSDLSADREQQLLRASIPVGGRSLTLYEEVHPLKHYANLKVHQCFMERLRQLLPKKACPIIVTDAQKRGVRSFLLTSDNWIGIF